MGQKLQQKTAGDMEQGLTHGCKRHSSWRGAFEHQRAAAHMSKAMALVAAQEGYMRGYSPAPGGPQCLPSTKGPALWAASSLRPKIKRQWIWHLSSFLTFKEGWNKHFPLPSLSCFSPQTQMLQREKETVQSANFIVSRNE